MKKISSLKSHILFKILIALAIYPLITSFLSKKMVQDRDDASDGNPMDLETFSHTFKGNHLVDQQFPMRIFSLNYFAFLLAMLAIDGFIKAIIQVFRKTEDIVNKGLPQSPEALLKANWKQGILHTVIISTVVCCFYHFKIGAQFGHLQEVQFHRLLEEDKSINYDYKQYQDDSSTERISLSLGKVLGSLNLNLNHMIVTKDMKYAFVTLLGSGGLKVIDLSNLAAPNVVKTFSPPTRSNLYKQRFMYLSPDEKALFVSGFESLEIIDVTNPESAFSLADVMDDEFEKMSGSFNNLRLSISFAFSADSKTLFIGGFGLQTFDISDIKSPILLDSQINSPHSSNPLLAIATSDDKNTLWVADETLDSYDISDAINKRFLNSFSESMNSLIFSHDKKMAFALGMIGSEKIQIAKLNLSNTASPVRTKSFILSQPSSKPAFIVSLSQKDRYMFIAVGKEQSKEDIIVTVDLEEERILSNDQSLLTKMATVTTLPRENFLLASGSGKTMIIEFYKDFPNREIFSLTDYPIWKMDMTNNYSNTAFSQDEKHLFVASTREPTSSVSLFEIYDFQNSASPVLLTSLEIDFTIVSILISADAKRAGLLDNERIIFYDTSDIAAPSYYSEFTVDSYSDIEDVAFWSESNIVFLIIHTYRSEKLRVIDISDPKSTSVLHELAFTGGEYLSLRMAFSHNKSLLFLAGPSLEIYSSSDVNNLDRIGSINVTTEETEVVYFVKASHDDKTCFVETLDRSSFHKLKIYDTSDLRNPKLASELILPMQIKKDDTFTPMLSKDSKTLYFLQKQDILAIDVSNIRVPRVFGLVPISNLSQYVIDDIRLSGDGRTMYFVTKNGTMHSMSVQVPQTLFLNQQEFYIGQQYSDSPMVLKLDGGSDYALMKDNEYKILKVGTFEVKVEATAETAKQSSMLLPSWARFDQASKILTLEPKKQTDLGYYTLCATMSNKVLASAFSFLDPPNLTVISTQLMSDLILRGYVDRQHFLISEIGSLEEFTLAGLSRKRDIEEIYRKLKEHFVVTCTTINILPSLKVEKEANQLSISSPNANFVKINIQLQNTTHARFLRKSYGSLSPVISNNKSHLMIEGPLKEANGALRNLTIDLENLKTCAAEMIVVDDMNPSVTMNLSDITSYFRINKPPYPNPKKSIQKQINMVPIYTGYYFTITLDRNTILDDDNSEDLNYKLISKASLTNDTIPSWLTFDDLTIRGTAPEELFDRNIEFILIASDEFKKVEIPFKLHLEISSTFVAKLILKYSPYILTIIGLYIQANKICNILGKKMYRHKKDFYVEIGEEITREVIFPIAFIQQEKKESEIIWEHLKKRISQSEMRNLIDESVGKERIVELIEEIVEKDVPQEKRKNLKIYLRGVEYRKKIIDQLIINKLVDIKLNSKEEKSTKMIFEKIKDKWSDLVNWDISSESFKTNLDKLDAIISGTEEDLSTSARLISKLHLYLLSSALEAHTFDCHTLDRPAIRTNVQLKEKTEKNYMQSFFKLDIESINHNHQLQTAYGISWSFENDSLVVTGVPCENFKDKTLVIEISNSNQKILKEIWIHEKNTFSSDNWSSRKGNVKNEKEEPYEVL